MDNVYVGYRPEINTSWMDSEDQECHITMVYTQSQSFEEVYTALKGKAYTRTATPWRTPIPCKVNGFGTWITPEGYCLYASVSDQGLRRVRWDIEDALHRAGIRVDWTYPFTPHITLGYSDTPIVSMPSMYEPYYFESGPMYVVDGDRREIL